MAKGKPSHPLTHTREKLEQILAKKGTQSNREYERRSIELQMRSPVRYQHREFEAERLNGTYGTGSLVRIRAKTPHVMEMERRGRFESAADARVRGLPSEPLLKPTSLNKAFDQHEVVAFDQYIIDRVEAVSGATTSRYGQMTNSTPAWDRVGVTEHQRNALKRINFVHRRMADEYVSDLNKIITMYVDNGAQKEFSISDYGKTQCKSEDPRVHSWAAIAAIKKIAQHLAFLYNLYHRIESTASELLGATTCHTLFVLEPA